MTREIEEQIYSNHITSTNIRMKEVEPFLGYNEVNWLLKKIRKKKEKI